MGKCDAHYNSTRPRPPLPRGRAVQLRDSTSGAQLRNQPIVAAPVDRAACSVAHAVALCALRLQFLLELVHLQQIRAHDVGPGALQRLVLLLQRLDLLAVAVLAPRPGGVVK